MIVNKIIHYFRMIGLRIVADDCYEVQKLVVAKNYRRHGISKILWEKMEKEGSQLCPNRIST